jgi:hypothetical protein
LWSNRPKRSPNPFWSKLTHNLYRGKKEPKNVDFVCNFQTLHNVCKG